MNFESRDCKNRLSHPRCKCYATGWACGCNLGKVSSGFFEVQCTCNLLLQEKQLGLRKRAAASTPAALPGEYSEPNWQLLRITKELWAIVLPYFSFGFAPVLEKFKGAAALLRVFNVCAVDSPIDSMAVAGQEGAFPARKRSRQ